VRFASVYDFHEISWQMSAWCRTRRNVSRYSLPTRWGQKRSSNIVALLPKAQSPSQEM